MLEAVLRPERQNAGNGQGHRIFDNVFANCARGGVVFLDPENQADRNVYVALPEKFGGFARAENIEWLSLAEWRGRGWDARGRIAEADIRVDADRLELTITGKSKLPSLPSFAKPIDSRTRTIDPRKTSKERP